jgi:hypothetical protein
MNKQGFASMNKDLQRAISSLGGKAVAAKTDMKALGRRGGMKSGVARRKKSEAVPAEEEAAK